MASGEKTVVRLLGAAMGCAAAVSWAGASGAARVIHEADKLLAADGSASDNAGVSVGLEGATALVGAPLADITATNGGGVVMYDAGTGLETGALAPAQLDSQDFFGSSMAIDEGIAVIGCPGDDDIANGAGAAYTFNITTGAMVAKLLPGSGQAGGLFGTTVDIEGGRAVVGAPFETPNGLGSGAAYIFDSLSGAQAARLVPDDGGAFERFGSAVSLSGGTVLVGAPSATRDGVSTGAVYVFDAKTGDQLAKITPADGAVGDQFGVSVSLNGTTAAIGATRNAEGGVASGSVYLFDVVSGDQLGKVRQPDAETGDAFGWSVVLCGDRLVVSAFGDADNGLDSGSAYVFDLAAGAETLKLLPSDGEAGDGFGVATSCDGDHVLAGAYRVDDNGLNAGAAYLFGLPCNVADFDEPFGQLDLADIVAFVTAFQAQEDSADLDDSGVFDLADIVLFAAAMGTGCG